MAAAAPALEGRYYVVLLPRGDYVLETVVRGVRDQVAGVVVDEARPL